MAAEGLGESNTGKISLPETFSPERGVGATLVIQRGHSVSVAGGACSRPS